MSTEIDQRVVELQFDNANFEKNAKESLSTLDKLKEKLSFKRTGEGLKELSQDIAKFTMKPIENAVDSVYRKFTFLDNFLWNFFDRISNKILDIGKKTVEAFTIDPIKTGFQEYETQMNAVQTILANTQSKGSTLDDVNEALDKLNKYADLTIYNFTEMTKNIGTFTAAGVGLEDATDAIQGIANLAAVSGSTSQQASTAMYQLSQALSAGSLKLQDWNSVVNAGMGGEVFQNALKQTAREYGIAVDAIIDKAGTFRESLKEGWITSEILTTTLKKMTVTGADEYLAKLTGISQQHIAALHEEAAASSDMEKGFRGLAKELAATGKVTEDQAYQLLNMSTTAQDAATKVKTFTQLMDTLKEAAQSGWTQTWELIIGDFGQAKELFTYLSDTFSGLINESSDTRNAIVAEAMGSDWERLTTVLTDAGVSMDTFKDTLIKNARESGVAIDEWIEADGSFEKTLQRGWLKDTDITKAFEDLAKGTGKATVSLEDYQKIVTDVVRGDYGNGAKRVEALTAANWDYAEVQAQVNKCWDGQVLHLDRLDTAQLKNIGMTEEQIEAYKKLAEESKDPTSALNQMIQDLSAPSGRDLLVDSLKNTLSGILTITKSIKKAFNQVFKPSASPIKKFLKIVNDLSKKFANVEEYAGQLTRTFSGLFSVLGILGDIIKGTLSFAFELLGKNVSIDAKSVLDFTAKIGDTIVAFRQWMNETNAVQNGLTKVKDNVVLVVEWIKDLFTSIQQSGVVTTTITRIQNGFHKLAEMVNLDFSNMGVMMTNFVNNVKSGDSFDFSNIPQALSDAKEQTDDEIQSFSFTLSGFAEYVKGNIVSAFKKAFNGIGNIFSGFISEVKIYAEAFGKAISGLNWGVVLSLFNAGFILATVDKVTKGLGSLADKFEPVQGILNAVKTSINKFSKVLEANALKTKAEALLELAAAIGILALSMTLLAAIPKENIQQSIGLLGAALISIAAMAGIAAVINKSSSSMTGAFMTLVGVGVAVGILSKVLIGLVKEFETVTATAKQVIAAVASVVGVMLALALAVGLMGLEFRNAGTTLGVNLKKVGPFIIAFAGALLLFATAFEKLAGIDKVLDMGVAVQLVGVIGAMVACAYLCKDVNAGAGIALLATASAMYILYELLNATPSVSDTSKWLKSIASILVITFVMTKVLKAMCGSLSQYAAKAGLGLMGFAAAMALIPIAISLIGAIKKDRLVKGVAAIGVLTLLFSLLIVATGKAGEFAHKAGITLLAAAGSIVALTAAIAALSLMPEEGLWRAIGCISILLSLFSLLTFATSKSKDAKTTIISMTGSIVALSAVVWLMSSFGDVNKTTLVVGQLIALMAAFTIMFNSLTKTGHLRAGVLKNIWEIYGVVAALSGLVLAISAISTYGGIETNITTIAGIVTLCAALTGMMVVLSKTGKLAPGVVGNVFALYGVMAAISGLVLLIGLIQGATGIEPSIATVGAISILMIALSTAMVIISAASRICDPAIVAKGILVFAAFVGGMALILSLLGGLQILLESIGGADAIQKGIDVMGWIGRAIGELIANLIVGGISGLPEIGTIMSEFMDNIQGFLTGLSDIDMDKAVGITNLTTILAALFSGRFKIKDAEKNAEMFTNLAENLDMLVPQLQKFSDSCAGLSNENLQKGCYAIEALITASKDIPNSGGIVSWFTGDNTWKKFATGLPEFGEALCEFSAKCAGINETGLNLGVAGTKGLSEVGLNLPNSGGVVSWFAGNNGWDKFQEGLADYGAALKSFSESCSGIDSAGMKLGCDGTASLAEVADKIPNSGGVAGAIFGENEWTTFRTGLSLYGDSLVLFSNACTSVNKASIKKGCDATAELSEVADDIPNSGGVGGAIFGENGWDTFKTGLALYGQSLALFSNYSKIIVLEAIDKGCDATEKLANTYDKIKRIKKEGFWSLIYTGLEEYGSVLKDFFDDLSPVNPSLINRVSKATDYFADALVKVKEGNLNKGFDWTGITDNVDQFRMLLATDLDALAYTASDDTINGVGRLKSIMDEIESVFNTVLAIPDLNVTAFTERISALVEGVKDVRDAAGIASLGFIKDAFEDIGEDIYDGISTGLSNTTTIDTAIKSVCDEIVSKFRSALMISSEGSGGSLKMKVYGTKMVVGFVEGLDGSCNLGSAAMAAFAEQMLTSFKDAVGIDNDTNPGVMAGQTVVEGYTATVTGRGAKAGANASEEFAEGVLTSADEAFANAETGSNWVEDTINNIKDKGGEYLNTAKNWVSDLFNGNSQGILDSLGIDLNQLLSGNFNVKDSDISKYFKALNSEVDGYSFDSNLQQAKDEFDVFFEEYKEGKIDQAEYDKQYTALLKKYTNEQVGIISYGQEKMKDHVEDTFKEINDDFEKTIEDIQKKMDDLSSGVVKSMEEAFTVKTNKDVYDEKMQEYQDRVDELTEKKEKLVEQYGEEHTLVKQAERDIESATNKMNEYKESYENSSQEAYDKQMAEYAAKLEKLEKKKARVTKRYGEESQAVRQVEHQMQKVNEEMEKYQKNHKVINDDDVASVDYADTFKKETDALVKYNSTIKQLKAKNVDDSILQMLAGETDVTKAAAIADYLNNLSDEERNFISGQYAIYKSAGNELAQTFYGDKMEQAVLDYTNTVISKMNSLPESAKSIGINMIDGLTSGFTSETEASLATIGKSGQSITDELKRIYDIHSPSRVMREEIGYNLADGLIQGFLDRIKMYTDKLSGLVMSDLGITADDSMIDVSSFDAVLTGLETAIQNRMNMQPTITPVLDLSQVDAGLAQMQATMSMQTPSYLVNSAMTVNSSDASVVAAINSLGTTISTKLDSINPISAIGILNTNVTTGINNLGNTINGMTVVLDTGTLVGEISADLGLASTMKGRGS